MKVATLICTKTPQKLKFQKRYHYPQKRRLLKTQMINVNAQKRRFLKILQYPAMSLTKTGSMRRHKNGYLWLRIYYQADQRERTKTDVFPSDFVQNGVMSKASFDATRVRHSKLEQCERSLTLCTPTFK